MKTIKFVSALMIGFFATSFFLSCEHNKKPVKEPTLVDVLIKNFQEHPKNWEEKNIINRYGSCSDCMEHESVIKNKSCGIILSVHSNMSYVTMITPDTIGFSRMESDSILQGYDDAIYKPARDRELRARIVIDSIKNANVKRKILNCE